MEASIPGLEPPRVERTDVHKDVPDRIAKFNFRLVFPQLAYLDIERKFKKNQNKKIEPQLQLKMFDKNIIGKEELGILVLPLTSIPNLGNQKERASK